MKLFKSATYFTYLMGSGYLGWSVGPHLYWLGWPGAATIIIAYCLIGAIVARWLDLEVKHWPSLLKWGEPKQPKQGLRAIEIIKGLAHGEGCWCGHAIGNPDMSKHVSSCRRTQVFMEEAGSK